MSEVDKEQWFRFYDDLWAYVKSQGLKELPTCSVGAACAPDGWSCCDFDSNGLIEYPHEMQWQERTVDFPKKRCGEPCNQYRPWMCVFWPVMPVAWRRDPVEYSEWALELILQCELVVLDPKSCAWQITLGAECGRLLVEEYPDLIEPFMKRQWGEFSPARTLGLVAAPEVLHRIVSDPMAGRLARTLVQFSHCPGACLNLRAYRTEPLFRGKDTVPFVRGGGRNGPHMVVPFER